MNVAHGEGIAGCTRPEVAWRHSALRDWRSSQLRATSHLVISGAVREGGGSSTTRRCIRVGEFLRSERDKFQLERGWQNGEAECFFGDQSK